MKTQMPQCLTMSRHFKKGPKLETSTKIHTFYFSNHSNINNNKKSRTYGTSEECRSNYKEGVTRRGGGGSLERRNMNVDQMMTEF